MCRRKDFFFHFESNKLKISVSHIYVGIIRIPWLNNSNVVRVLPSRSNDYVERNKKNEKK